MIFQIDPGHKCLLSRTFRHITGHLVIVLCKAIAILDSFLSRVHMCFIFLFRI